MNSNLIRKLVLLLRYKNKENKQIMKFVNSIGSNQIPEDLLVYLYNYLYNGQVSSIIDLYYEKGKIVIEEQVRSNEGFKYKLSVIEQNHGLGDIKRTTAVAEVDQNDIITSKKQIYYSLTSCIDLIILETKANQVNHNLAIGELLRGTIRRRDYNRICFLSSREPSLRIYKSHEKQEEGYVESLVFLDNDSLKPFVWGEQIPPQNITDDTQDSIKNLVELYGKGEMIMDPNQPYEMFTNNNDYDLLNYFDDINPIQK